MIASRPAQSLQTGTWFKLICGASFHHLSSIRTLAFIYTIAGADCIDVAADPAVVRAARAGIALGLERDARAVSPWLMASFNDGVDPHFRKVKLLATSCPQACPQPCVTACPPGAIAFSGTRAEVTTDLCYGCGRCLPLCVPNLLAAEERSIAVSDVMPSLVAAGVRAIELHTKVGRREAFARLWQQCQPWVDRLHLISVSCGDGPGLEPYLRDLEHLMQPRSPYLIWQTDGRPMSGDIGAGTTRAALRLAQKVTAIKLPGYVQLAGGTNESTARKLRRDRLAVAGVAYGSYARKLVADVCQDGSQLELFVLDRETSPLQTSIDRARALVADLKRSPFVPAEPVPLSARSPL
ncbi:MAG: LdpA C-terminal domain-containing domain [Cyanobacteria bacterium J06642_2]